MFNPVRSIVAILLEVPVGLLATYPYATMALVVVAYLAIIPLSYRRFHEKLSQDRAEAAARAAAMGNGVGGMGPVMGAEVGRIAPSTETKH